MKMRKGLWILHVYVYVKEREHRWAFSLCPLCSLGLTQCLAYIIVNVQKNTC